ncbi:phosphoribosyltransferase family protein [Streptomyces sp. NBC_00287]|uniref:phosphoribosyltransferase family protein n=1 Tax=Streptomyces sp. NBC_00287 TaxID=2975702 RepID=UPI003FA75E9B
MPFRDRRQAGRELAARLRVRPEKGALPYPAVLALPRGGVAMARAVAEALDAPLDVLVTRSIGVPFPEEVGVDAPGGEDPLLFDLVERERAEAHRREERYRRGCPVPDLTGHTAIVVGDGLATGSTARAAVRCPRAWSSRCRCVRRIRPTCCAARPTTCSACVGQTRATRTRTSSS